MEEIAVPVDYKLIAVLENTKADMIRACQYGLAMSERKDDVIAKKYWQEEMDEINKLDYQALHVIFIDVHYRKLNV